MALEIAAGDERLANFLSEHTFELERIRPRPDGVVDVFVRLDEPVPMSEWPLDVCDNTWRNLPMTGIHWRVDLESEAILSLSPLWDEATCITD